MNGSTAQAAAERHLQVALQTAIDIAVHILAEDTARPPDEYGAAFLALGDLGVFDAELAARLRMAAGMRNVLVHDYLEVDSSLVWQAIENLGDLDAFAAAVDRYLS